MNWPPASDYQDAIQNPSFCFQDAELRAGQPAVNRIGLPRVASGNFASVYQIHSAGEKWAVRCFLRQGADQRRYAVLSEYLNGAAITGLVDFAYLSPGIKVRGQWYPIVKMDWVEGITLQTYVAKHLNDPARLRSVALQWRGLLDRLRQSHIAHCDLQHGNILVTPQEQLRLVDYDGMYVPALRGNPSYELGHPNYQHPLRRPSDYDEHLDNFSALIIYTALRALIAEPGLWAKFDTGENLLFSAPDLKNPAGSDLFRRLRQSQDSAVRTLADRIAYSCAGTPAGTPDFKELVDSLPPIPEPEPWWHSAAQSRNRERPAPEVPPLPPDFQPGPRREQETVGQPDLPWWSKRPSTLISEFRPPAWFAPSDIAATAVRQLRTLPVRQTAQRGVGCIGAVALSCGVAIMLWIGVALALQFLFQQLFGATPHPRPSASPPSINAQLSAPAPRFRRSSNHGTVAAP